MSNDDYYELVRSEWQKILGESAPVVTDEERKELHELIRSQNAQKGSDSNVH